MRQGSSKNKLLFDVVDFFSGCGGTSSGLKASGASILLGIDVDHDSAETFAANFPEASFCEGDIRKLTTEVVALHIPKMRERPLLFAGCAPCQPFSQQNRRAGSADDRTFLLLEFLRFIEAFSPELILVENVPGLERFKMVTPFNDFTDRLGQLGYHAAWKVIDSRNFGVPQRRRRLVLIASRLGPISFPNATHGPGTDHPSYSTVREWIGHLPPIAAGEIHPHIPNHHSASLKPINLQRIQSTPTGSGRESWPEELIIECHKDGYKGHMDVYGRMSWDAPAQGLTTRCTSLSNGRFGHPDQDRAISVLEAALLQTFPSDFKFIGGMQSRSRQIGNAVPALLAEQFGVHFKAHLESLATGYAAPGDLTLHSQSHQGRLKLG